MPLLRASQTTFEEVYKMISQDGTGPFAEESKLMLNFISFVDQLFPKTVIWGLTSHENILILDKMNKEKVIGRISIKELSHYKFEYGEGFLELYPENQNTLIPVNDINGVKHAFLALLEYTSDWSDNSEFNLAKIDK